MRERQHRWDIGGPLASEICAVDVVDSQVARAVGVVIEACLAEAPGLGAPTVAPPPAPGGPVVIAWEATGLTVCVTSSGWVVGRYSGDLGAFGVGLLRVVAAQRHGEYEQDQARGE